MEESCCPRALTAICNSFAVRDGCQTRLPRIITQVRRNRLPAWWADAKGVGTRYNRVEMPSATCKQAKPTTPWTPFLALGGKRRFIVGDLKV